MAVSGFSQGIHFEEGDWQTVKAKAAKENKLIYLDIYTTWCGPCKMMAAKYFPAKEAGDYFNAHFINYKIDAEKGEGITIAKTYAVRGYPTNLFIDANTDKLVYRTMGMPQSLEAFIEKGVIAYEEYQDKMSMEEYQQKFEKGNYDEAFLRKYLRKNNRLALDNDKALDAYLQQYGDKITDSLFLELLSYQTGVSNSAYKFFEKNKARINKLKSDENGFENLKNYWYQQNLQKTIDHKDEKMMKTLLARAKEFNTGNEDLIAFYYQSELYKKMNDEDKLWSTQKKFAENVMQLSEEDFINLNKKAEENIIKQIEWQAKQMGVPDEKLEEIIQNNLARPEIKYSSQIQYAQLLNQIAWGIYEKNAQKNTSSEKINLTTTWAKKAMSLVENIPQSWVPISDTYAHLLALQGKKKEAIDIQEKVVAKAKEIRDANFNEYETFLKELKK